MWGRRDGIDGRRSRKKKKGSKPGADDNSVWNKTVLFLAKKVGGFS
jgi:hypothetical protein